MQTPTPPNLARIRGMLIFWAMLTCISVLPLALIAGPIRGIPWYHIGVDCCFGIFGLIPLALLRRWIRQMEFAR